MKTAKITKVISSGHELPIRGLDGKITIFQAKYVFNSWIDFDFEKFGLDKLSQSTKKVNAVVSEIIADGTFFQIFTDINPDLGKSVLTMSQIIEFCEKYPSWLSQKGLATFFLTKKNLSTFRKILSRIRVLFGKKMLKHYFVVRVRVSDDGRLVSVLRLEHDHLWDGEARRRVVVPQQLDN
jgi:hypothetical protein